MPSFVRLIATTVPLFLTLCIACGSETVSDAASTSSGAGGADDGKLRPEGNGVRISETEACEAMRGAVSDAAQVMNCVKTLPACPNFVRVRYPTQCAEYDQGAVQGCVDHWTSITNGCQFLDETDCVVAYFPENAPAGCP